MKINITKAEQTDYSKEIDYLEELIRTIQSDVQFTVTVAIAVLAVAVTIAGWALSVLARKWVDDKVKQEIDQIKLDNERFKDSLNKRLLKVMKDNPQIRWASGTTNYMNLRIGENHFRIDNLDGNILWESPITSIKITSMVDGRDIPYKVVDKSPKSFIFELPEFNPDSDGEMIKWSIVWSDEGE